MLEKINNINTGGSFDKEPKLSNFNLILSSTYSKKLDIHDSIDISPAFKFLNRINWKLKNFKHIPDDRVFINFVASDIEFKTAVDLVNLNNLQSLNYLVLKDAVNLKNPKKIMMDLSVKTNNINYNRKPVIITFSSMNLLFQRFSDFNIYREITRDEKYLFDDLLDGIIDKVNHEMEYLNNNIFIFIDKLSGIRITKRKLFRNNYGEPVAIKKIKLINDD